MTRFLIALALLFMVPMGHAQDTELHLPPEDMRGIENTIASQVAAFRAGDMETAFTYAAPNIQATFGTPEVFGMMVERGYGQIFSTLDYEFQRLIGTPAQPIQVVAFTGTDLSSVIAFYVMELQPDGHWRIAGVQIIPAEQQAI